MDLSWATAGLLRLRDVSPPAVAAHTISAATRRRSVGSDGEPHLERHRVADGDDDICGRGHGVPSLPECAPDHCVRTPSPRQAPVRLLPPLRRHDGVGTATSSRATRDAPVSADQSIPQRRCKCRI